MEMPLVSVIIPCYNVEKYIDVCMESLLKQSIGFEQLEVILVNDASSDNTLDKLYLYEKEHPDQILVINCEINRKQGYARNLGIQYSRAKYITFLDSDDYVALDLIEKLYQRATQEKLDYAVCNYYHVIGGKPIVLKGQDQEEEACFDIRSEADRRKFLMTSLPVRGPWGILYRKEFLVEHDILFPADTYYEDLYWHGLLGFYAKKVCIIPDRLYYYVNQDNKSVLMKPESSHHFMRLDVMELYLEEVKKRGLYDKYKDEVEIYFLRLYWINSIPFFALRFEHCPLDIMIHMRKTVLEKVPDYAVNPYIREYSSSKQIYLQLIELDLRTQEEWDEIFRAIREDLG